MLLGSAELTSVEGAVLLVGLLDAFELDSAEEVFDDASNDSGSFFMLLTKTES